MSVQIINEQLLKIRSHGEETFPEECCGVLIGKNGNGNIQITEARKMRNINSGSKNTRYNIDPLDLVRLEKELDTAGLEMIGIYHSHPNHPARPSQFDLDHAWPNLSYFVLSVDDGQANLLTSWRLDQKGENFIEEEIKKEQLL